MAVNAEILIGRRAVLGAAAAGAAGAAAIGVSPSVASATAPPDSGNGDALPTVIHSPHGAKPGQVLGFYGGAMTGATVAFQPLTGARAVSIEHAPVVGSVIDAQDNLVHALLPTHTPKDVYAAWVQTSTGSSEPAYLNRAEPQWLSEHTVYPMQHVRCVGRNFLNPRTGRVDGLRLSVVSTDGRQRSRARVITATEYAIDFVVPRDVRPGQKYVVEVTNGAGGRWGTALLPQAEAVDVVAANASVLALSTMLGTQAAWLADIPHKQEWNVREFGAEGDGATDDTAAIQSALDEAGSHGGGIVRIPSGTYSFSSISIPASTILLGAGPDRTNLVYNNQPIPDRYRTIIARRSLPPPVGTNPTSNYGEASKLIYSDQSHVGVVGLSITSSYVRPESNAQRLIYGSICPIAFLGYDIWAEDTTPIAPSVGCLIKNVRINVTDGGGPVTIAESDIIIEDCVEYGTHGGLEIRASRSIRIRNNHFRGQMRPGILSNPPDPLQNGHGWIEGNTLHSDNISSIPTPPPNWSELAGTQENRCMDLGTNMNYYVARNTTTGIWGPPNGNDGEGILWQGTAALALGAVHTATPYDVTDSSAVLVQSSLAGSYVSIIAGTGIGQLRRVTGNTTTQITVDVPWQIIPDATSQYAVDRCVNQGNICVDNTLLAHNCKGGIVLYTKHYDCVVAGNRMENNGGIWLGCSVAAPVRDYYAYFTTVSDNIIIGATDAHSGKYCVTIGPGSDGGQRPVWIAGGPYAVIYYGSEIRANNLTANGSSLPADKLNIWSEGNGIMVASRTVPTATVPMTQGIIIEDNTVTNALAGLHLSGASYDTTLHRNRFTGNGIAIDDSGSIRTITI